MNMQEQTRANDRMSGGVLALIIKKFRERPPGSPDPIALNPAEQARFNSWNAGFEAFERGESIEANSAYGRARPLWKEGWLAAQRIEQLIAEQAGNNASL